MQNYQQKENTTYIDGFAVLFFDGMSKERKKYKRTKCNLWRTGKIQKKYKNTNCIFVRNGKIQKKIQKYKVYFFCILFVFFSYFYKKNTKKIQKQYRKNTKKIRMQLLKNTKYKKNTNQQFQKYKIQKKYEPKISKIQNTKKIRTQNFKNTKYKEKTNSKISQRANPVFTFGNQEPKYKKNTKPTSCIFQTLQFWFCIFGLYFFRMFFVFLNIGRRPFCSHPGQLKASSSYGPGVVTNGHPDSPGPTYHEESQRV